MSDLSDEIRFALFLQSVKRMPDIQPILWMTQSDPRSGGTYSLTPAPKEGHNQ